MRERKDEKGQNGDFWLSFRGDGQRSSVNVFVLDPILPPECRGQVVSFGSFKDYMR